MFIHKSSNSISLLIMFAHYCKYTSDIPCAFNYALCHRTAGISIQLYPLHLFSTNVAGTHEV